MNELKAVKPMVKFFDYLYDSLEVIDPVALEEWAHKESPVAVWVLMDESDLHEKELSLQWGTVFYNEADAIEEMNAYNE